MPAVEGLDSTRSVVARVIGSPWRFRTVSFVPAANLRSLDAPDCSAVGLAAHQFRNRFSLSEPGPSPGLTWNGPMRPDITIVTTVTRLNFRMDGIIFFSRLAGPMSKCEKQPVFKAIQRFPRRANALP